MTSEDEALILSTLLELKGDMGTVKGSIVEIKDAHAQRLESLETMDKWQWGVHIAVVPVVAAIHQLAVKLGLNKG
jgi:hypothetical protein